MPKDSILSKPTLPEVKDNRGPLYYDVTVNGNDVDVSDKDLDHVDSPDSDEKSE